MSNPWLEIIIILLLFVLNGVFAMSEIALVSARKVRLQQRAEDGDKAAGQALALVENPNRLLSTIQIFITLINILTGTLGGAVLAGHLAEGIAKVPWLASSASTLALALVVLASTYLSLVVGELIPKRLGLNDPEGTASSVSGLMRFLSWLTAPVVSLLSASTDLGLRILGVSPSKEPPITQDEIKVLMEQGTQVGVFEEAEQDMVESVFRLSDRYVDAVMTPRTEIEWVDLDDPLDQILREMNDSSHSRFPAAHGSLDAVIGVLETRQVLARQLAGGPVDLLELVQPPLLIPESSSAMDVLEQFRESGTHLALVIDEYGGLLGMVTTFDILEAIVGDLPARGASEQAAITRREDGSYLLDGLLPVDEFKELFELDELPDEERVGFQTVGGFVMHRLGAIPAAGQYFDWHDLRFEVVDMDGRRVDKVLVSPLHLKPEDSTQ